MFDYLKRVQDNFTFETVPPPEKNEYPTPLGKEGLSALSKQFNKLYFECKEKLIMHNDTEGQFYIDSLYLSFIQYIQKPTLGSTILPHLSDYHYNLMRNKNNVS